MKKLILLCTLYLCAAGVFAQDAAPKNALELTDKNMKTVLTDLFAGNPAPEQNAKTPAQKKWQAAFFLTTDHISWTNINALTNQLLAQYKKGTLQQAVVLYDRKAKKESGMRPQEDGVYLFFIGNFKNKQTDAARAWSEEAPIYNYYFNAELSQHKKTISEMLALVLNGMNGQTNTYNYFQINAHGEGITMDDYAPGNAFTFDTIHNAIKRSGMHIHVLDVFSCMMGTAANAYTVLAEGTVDYVLLSSNIAISWFHLANTPILEHLDKAPKQAAILATQERIDLKNKSNFTHNIMLIGRQSINTLKEFDSWLKQDYAAKKLPANKIPTPKDSSNAQHGNISINQLLLAWRKLVPCNFHNITQNTNNCRLQMKANKLRKNLQNAVIAYRCWDTQKQQLFTSIDQLPENSECMDGMTVNKQYLVPQKTTNQTAQNLIPQIHNLLHK